MEKVRGGLMVKRWISSDDERKINRWKRNVSKSNGKVVKMIKYFGGNFNDYSVSPKINV